MLYCQNYVVEVCVILPKLCHKNVLYFQKYVVVYQEVYPEAYPKYTQKYTGSSPRRGRARFIVYNVF